MLTQSATRSVSRDETVRTIAALHALGWTDGAIRAQLEARRWQRFGRAVVLHTGAPNPTERRAVALGNAPRRALLTGFTAAEVYGLRGWERPMIDVLVPSGARVPGARDLGVRVHYTGDWGLACLGSIPGRRLQQCAAALVVAASTFAKPRPACGLLAAGVQQRLVAASELRDALVLATRTRHRAHLVAAVADIAQGAQALSEIDFARLCRRARLPEPSRQRIRPEPSGQRRYLDVEWDQPDGRRLVVEVDGAVHLEVQRWYDDQLRQNEVSIAGATVLRFPSVVVRTEPRLVLDQLARALRS